MANDERTTAGELPTAPVERWLTPIRRFLHIESASGVVLLACTVLALILANSPLAGWFASIWKTKVELNLGDFQLAGDLGHLVINDGLMAIFFLVIGLEIKREIVAGELRELRKALLPVFAAIGGMAVPAGVYLAAAGVGRLGRSDRCAQLFVEDGSARVGQLGVCDLELVIFAARDGEREQEDCGCSSGETPWKPVHDAFPNRVAAQIPRFDARPTRAPRRVTGR